LTDVPSSWYIAVLADVASTKQLNPLYLKAEVARKGEQQGNVFGAREHERGGYKGLLKQGNT
jgi:hypothetical protein